MTTRKAVTKRSILGSFMVCAFYRMDKDHHIKKYTTITCVDVNHDDASDNTITWLYHTWLPNRQGNGMTKDHTAYICSRCAYRAIRKHCDTPIEATRYLFVGAHGRSVVTARHSASSQGFIAQTVAPDRVTSKLLTEWLFSLYVQVA